MMDGRVVGAGHVRLARHRAGGQQERVVRLVIFSAGRLAHVDGLAVAVDGDGLAAAPEVDGEPVAELLRGGHEEVVT